MHSKKKTSVEKAKNLGPVVSSELSTININSLEKIIELGWEEVCIRYGEAYPHRINMNAFTSIIGAIENQSWNNIDTSLKAEAKSLLKKLKREVVF